MGADLSDFADDATHGPLSRVDLGTYGASHRQVIRYTCNVIADVLTSHVTTTDPHSQVIR